MLDCTCQLLIPDFPNIWRKAFDQGRKTGKPSPNFAESRLFEELGETCERDSCRPPLVEHKVCSDNPYDLVERPAPVCHLAWSVGGFSSRCTTCGWRCQGEGGGWTVVGVQLSSGRGAQSCDRQAQ